MSLSLYNARQFHTQQVHYIRKSVAISDAATTIDVGVIPSGAVINFAMSGVHVHAAFNAGTNNRLDIGASTDTGTNNFGTLLALGTVGFVPLDEGANTTSKMAADTNVQAYVDVTGNAATTGSATIIICYIPDNDR